MPKQLFTHVPAQPEHDVQPEQPVEQVPEQEVHPLVQVSIQPLVHVAVQLFTQVPKHPLHSLLHDPLQP